MPQERSLQIGLHRETSIALAAADKERFEHTIKLCLWQCAFGGAALTILVSVRTWFVDAPAAPISRLLYLTMVVVGIGITLGLRAYHEAIDAMEWRNIESLARIQILEDLECPEGLGGGLSTRQATEVATARQQISKSRKNHEKHLAHAAYLLKRQAQFLTAGSFGAMLALMVAAAPDGLGSTLEGMWSWLAETTRALR